MIDATPGGANADVYCTLAFANAYHANSLYTDDWFNRTQDDLAVALVVATQYIDYFSYRGYATSTTQALKFPRSGIVYQGGIVESTTVPIQIQNACAQIALEYIRTDFAKRATTSASSGSVTQIKAGSFQINYGAGGAAISADVEFLSPISLKLLEPFRRPHGGLIRV